MSIYMFFEKICFGENGYPISLTEINEFINSHINSLLSLKHDAIKFESKTIAEKYNKETGNSEPIYRIQDKKWLGEKCGKWLYFLNELEKLINKSYDSNNLNAIYKKLCDELGSIKILLVENGQTRKIFYRNKRDGSEGLYYDNKAYYLFLHDIQNDYITQINQLTDTNPLVIHHENFNSIKEKLKLAHNKIWSYMPNGYSLGKDISKEYPSFKIKDFLIDMLEILKSELLIENIKNQSDYSIVNDAKILTELSDEISYQWETISKLINKLKVLIPKQKASDLTGFKSNLEPHQIEKIFNKLKGSYINEDTNPEHFKAIFQDEVLPNEFIGEKIQWTKSIPLFCCLMFGYTEVEYQKQIISFTGIISQETIHFYKKAIQFFSFGMKKVTNKTLSEKTSRLSNCNAPQNFDTLYAIIKTVQTSTV